MNAVSICPYCAKPVAANAIGGLCPECLLKAALASNAGTNPTQFTPPEITALAPHFPQLEILELIGHGGMGAVYRARQPSLNRLVALKILPAEHTAANPGFADRFQREARALARLNHPNIVAVYDFGQTAGFHFLIMEHVEGVNLRHLQRAEKIAPAQALQIVRQICEALQFAHDAGIVHRDIKPENILIDKSGRVKIADFGLAKILAPNAPDFGITQAGHSMGTPHYMAPEQVEQPGEVDHRADIYSLGVVFYELLTGELPLGRFSPPSKRAQIDFRLDEIVLRALEKEPARRYQKASDVQREVHTVQTVADAPPRGKRGIGAVVKIVAIVVIAAGVLILAGLGLFVIYELQHQKASDRRRAAIAAATVDAAVNLPPGVSNIFIAPGPNRPVDLLGGSRPVDLVISPAAKDALVNKIVAMNGGTWRQALATAEQIAALPDDEGLTLVRLYWQSITNAEARKQFLKAFTFAGNPRLLPVLELGILDSAPEVQSWGLAYLKSVTGRDFSEDYAAATEYLAARRDWSLEDALSETARALAQGLKSPDDAAVEAQLKGLDEVSLLRDRPQALVNSGIEQALEAVVTDRSKQLVEHALQTAGKVPLSAEWYQRVAAPRLATNFPVSIRVAAARALGKQTGEWAVEPLAGALSDLARIDEVHRNSLAFAVGSALGETKSPKAIAPMIAAIQADNSYATIYGLGYFGLTPITGVPYNEKHDGAWWADWWEKNKARYPQ